MYFELIEELEDKENKTEVEWTLLNYYKTFAIIIDILVEESKFHVSSEEAIKTIRQVIIENT